MNYGINTIWHEVVHLCLSLQLARNCEIQVNLYTNKSADSENLRKQIKGDSN